MKRAISIVFALLLFMGAAQGAPPAYTTPTVGGGAGGPLALYCDGPRFLSGFYVRSGYWIDAASIICSRVKGNGKNISLQQETSANIIFEGPGGVRSIGGTAMFGGGGGGPVPLLCDRSDEVVKGVVIQRSPNNFVGYIQPRCASLNYPGEPYNTFAFAGRISSKSPPPVVLDCPFNMAAIGFYGATGVFVDRFGLVCAEMKFLWPGVAIAVSGNWQIWGASIHPDGPHSANSDALRRCGQWDCRVAVSDRGLCIAIARSDFNGVWYGWAYGSDPAPLRATALNECLVWSKSDVCQIIHTNCL